MFETLGTDMTEVVSFFTEHSAAIQAVSALAMLYLTKKLADVSDFQARLLRIQAEKNKPEVTAYVEPVSVREAKVTFYNTGAEALIIKEIALDGKTLAPEPRLDGDSMDFYTFRPYSAKCLTIPLATQFFTIIFPDQSTFKFDIYEHLRVPIKIKNAAL